MEQISIKMPKMITIQQAADSIPGVCYHTVRNWCLSGALPYVRAGGARGRILISADRLAAFLNGESDDVQM